MRNQEIGFVFQFHFLIKELTVCENAALPLRKAGGSSNDANKRAKDVLRKLGLEDKLNRFANKLSGEQQRVAIVCALVHSPALLLADEPTGNWTAPIQKRFSNLLQFARDEGIAVILVTHNSELAEKCDRILRMRDGRLVSD